LRLAEAIFALGIEAAQCPPGHFDLRLASGWPDPYYRESLERLGKLLRDSQRLALGHQAPACWRVLPNVLGNALRAVHEVSVAAEIGLQSLKDNPTFLMSEMGSEEDLVVSSGGYHDHRAAKAIDQMNSALADLCVLASRQVSHLLNGVGLGLPALLARGGDRIGTEYLAWTMTEPLASARRASDPTTLDLSLRDPAGDQSDIAAPAFIAYAKHREAAGAFDACFAALAATVALALEFRDGPLPTDLKPMAERLTAIARSGDGRADVVAEPLRRLGALLRASAEDMTSDGFAASMR
jgi:histidine ammonia-lyase